MNYGFGVVFGAAAAWAALRAATRSAFFAAWAALRAATRSAFFAAWAASRAAAFTGSTVLATCLVEGSELVVSAEDSAGSETRTAAIAVAEITLKDVVIQRKYCTRPLNAREPLPLEVNSDCEKGEIIQFKR